MGQHREGEASAFDVCPLGEVINLEGERRWEGC